MAATASPPLRTSSGASGKDEADPLSRFVLPAILLVALILRIVVARRTSVIFDDGVHFLEIAKHFAAGDFAAALAHPYHPLYSALTALTAPMTGNLETAGVLVSVVAGTLAIAAVFAFLRAAFDARVAAFGAFLFAVSPYAVRFTADVQSEGVYLACFWLAVVFLYAGLTRNGSVQLAAGGVAAGFAYLARPEGAGLVAIALGWLAVAGVRGLRSWSDVFRGSVAMLAGLVIVAGPYLGYLAESRGHFVLSGKKSLSRTLGVSDPLTGDLAIWAVIALLVLALVAILRAAAAQGSGAVGYPGERWARWGWLGVGLGFCTACVFVAPSAVANFGTIALSTLRPEVAVLVCVGLVVALRGGGETRDRFIVAVSLAYAVVLIGLLENYGYLSRRHVLPLVPLWLGYAGVGALGFADRLSKRRLRGLPPLTASRALAVIAIAMLAIAAPKALDDHREGVLAARLAAEWMRDQPLQAGHLASLKRRIGYYAGRPWQPLTEGGGLREVDALVAAGVRYVLADDGAPGAPDVLAEKSGFTVLEVHRVTAGGRTAKVYELLRATDVGEDGFATARPDSETH